MKVSAPYKILAGFLVLIGAVTGGRYLYAEWSLKDVHYPPLAPEEVNIIGVDTSKGYHIVVSNRIAQLALGNRGEFGPDSDRSESSETAAKRRIPIREMLDSIRGDEKALSQFVMKLAEVDQDEFSPVAVRWPAEELQKALDGDKALASKLERDLNIRLDGTPLDVASEAALEGGILIEIPVPIHIQEGPNRPAAKLTARVLEPFKTRFAERVRKHYQDKTPTSQMIAGYYREEAQKVLSGTEVREDVAGALRSRLASDHSAIYAGIPTEILNSIEVIVTSKLMTDAKVTRVGTGDERPTYNLNIDLNEEGRNRLWQFSRGHVGRQLLVVWRGVAVAAPYIEHELSDPRVTITKMEDETIANRTAETIQGASTGDTIR